LNICGGTIIAGKEASNDDIGNILSALMHEISAFENIMKVHMHTV
jgi:hypothetical protein